MHDCSAAQHMQRTISCDQDADLVAESLSQLGDLPVLGFDDALQLQSGNVRVHPATNDVLRVRIREQSFTTNRLTEDA